MVLQWTIKLAKTSNNFTVCICGLCIACGLLETLPLVGASASAHVRVKMKTSTFKAGLKSPRTLARRSWSLLISVSSSASAPAADHNFNWICPSELTSLSGLLVHQALAVLPVKIASTINNIAKQLTELDDLLDAKDSPLFLNPENVDKTTLILQSLGLHSDIICSSGPSYPTYLRRCWQTSSAHCQQRLFLP